MRIERVRSDEGGKKGRRKMEIGGVMEKKGDGGERAIGDRRIQIHHR